MEQQLQDALKKYFGYEEFRPLQKEIMLSVLGKKDTFVLMPTGGGKSLCYQIPALVSRGIVVVVSPLISLMQDQVDALLQNGIGAAFLNSTQTAVESEEIKQSAQKGDLKLLYVSPERLLSSDFLFFLQSLDIAFFAIDEAHCISSWGHDFRPEYTRLNILKNNFPDCPIIALTATADRLTRKDIIGQLNLEAPKVFVASFDRPNLSLTVLPGKKRFERILSYIETKPSESGIIYCLSRKNTEKIATKLRQNGISASHYHAGMSAEERSRVQDNFIHGRTPVICATIAFGMGIDKSNVRYVMHYNLPKNIEGYYQEIGRAGRDGLPSDTFLFYTFQDVVLLRKILAENGNKNVQLAKLDRMQQFSDSLTCRRKILLHYFDEYLDEDCGNCDVCTNPPEIFDGTEIVQKALSAIARTGQKLAVSWLIDILRGSKRQEILSYGYDKIKTYGAGKEISSEEWNQYFLQMLNLGLIYIAYEAGHAIKITPQGKEVLLGKKKINLVHLSSFEKRIQEQEKQEKERKKNFDADEELFEVLRDLRRKLAKEEEVPPYVVFSDASLEEMSAVKPIEPKAFRKISGVGDMKQKKYSEIFLGEIRKFLALHGKTRERVADTHEETYLLYKQGLPVASIARERGLKDNTVYAHLVRLIENGHDIDLLKFMDKGTKKKVWEVIDEKGYNRGLKVFFNALGESIDYEKIKLVLADYKRSLREKGVFVE